MKPLRILLVDDSYDEVRRSIDAELHAVRKLTAAHAAQRQFSILAPLLAERMAVFQENAERRRDQGFAAVQAAIATGRGNELHDRVRKSATWIEAAAPSLLKERGARAEHSSTVTRTVIISGSAR